VLETGNWKLETGHWNVSHGPASTAACPGSNPTNQAATGDCSMLSSGCRCRPAYIACAYVSWPIRPASPPRPLLVVPACTRPACAPQRRQRAGGGAWDWIRRCFPPRHMPFARACCRKPLDVSPTRGTTWRGPRDLPTCTEYIVRAPSGYTLKLPRGRCDTDCMSARMCQPCARHRSCSTHQASWVRASLDGAHRDTKRGAQQHACRPCTAR